MIYLDSHATTPMLSEVWEAMRPFALEQFGNPASVHGVGRKARAALGDAREQIAHLLSAHPDEVIFTSGATEANNLAVFGLAGSAPGHVVSSPIEHPCVAEPVRQLAARWFVVDYVPVDANGVVRVDRFRELLRPDTRLAVVMLVNHETGSVQPVRELTGLCDAGQPMVRGTPPTPPSAKGGNRTAVATTASVSGELVSPSPKETVHSGRDAVGFPLLAEGGVGGVPRTSGSRHSPVPFHCDAAQAVGKFPVNFHELGVTTLSFSAHKFGGPKGIGGLIVKRTGKLTPQLFGGHQQNNRRPGTESVMLAVGMATALKIATDRLTANREHVGRLRTLFRERLQSLASPVVINSPAGGSPFVLNVAFPGCRAELLLMMLDLAGIACSTGSACSSGSLLPSPVLSAMGVPEAVLDSAMRFSFGPALVEADILAATEKIALAVARSR